MTTYWHIAHPSYVGGDLLCRNELTQQGIAAQWAWGDDAPEGFDGDVVCLFPDTDDGRRDADWLWSERPDHVLLRVEIPEDSDQTIAQVEEGYPGLLDHVDADWITEIRRGYADGAIKA